MKITEYQRGYQDAARQMITWLHEEAATMNAPPPPGASSTAPPLRLA